MSVSSPLLEIGSVFSTAPNAKNLMDLLVDPNYAVQAAVGSLQSLLVTLIVKSTFEGTIE